MVKEATKLGPKEDEPPEKKLKTENKALRLEKEQLWLEKEQLWTELQKEKQQKEELRNMLINLSAPTEPTWHAATYGAQTNPFEHELGLEYAAEGPKAAADEPDFFNWNTPIL
eukprot:scaffold131109_cov69-Phaeocystis_antarctica.AAC.3